MIIHIHKWKEYKDEGNRVLLACTQPKCTETMIVEKRLPVKSKIKTKLLGVYVGYGTSRKRY